MPIVTAIYAREPGKRFDYDYYRDHHLPLIPKHWAKLGCRSVRVLRGVASMDGGDPPYFAMAFLTFDSQAAIAAALADEAAVAEMAADIPRFTDVTPVMQVNEDL